MADLSIAELKRRLADRAEDIAARILTDTKREGGELVGYGRDGSKFKVHLVGRKRGMVLDTSAPNDRGELRRGGSLLNLVTFQLGGGELRAGIKASLALLGLEGAPAPARPASPADLARQREARARAAEADTARRRDRALAIWRAGQAIERNAPVWHYLAGRCCAMQSDALRAGRVWHREAGAELDAMIAAVIDPRGGRMLGVHVTYLALERGAWRKAPVASPKLTHGPIGGGVIPLLRDRRGVPIGAAGLEALLLAEGIENALTAARLFPGLRCWAGLSIGNLARLALPGRFATVRLVRDRDGDKAQLRELREAMIARWQREGRAVRPIDPPAGHKDLNAWACALAVPGRLTV